MPINQLNNGDSGLTARTIINDLVSNINNGSSGSYTGSFSGSFIGNLIGQADTAAVAVVALNYAETDPVFTAKESTLITTSSFNAFISEYNLWTGSATSQFAGTASYINLTAGPGIDINGLVITASVRSVNNIFPTNGNIAIALSSTQTGTSASLVASSSGAITSSLADGLVWIISGDPTPANNGDAYIWNLNTTQWYPIAPLDQSAGDARYIISS